MSGIAKKNKLTIIIGVILAAAVIVLTVLICGDFWGGYEYSKTYTTADNVHDIVLYSASPLISSFLNDRTKYKMVCIDNSDGKEVEYTEFVSEPCKGGGFSLENDYAERCTFYVSDADGTRKFDLVWNEIFT